MNSQNEYLFISLNCLRQAAAAAKSLVSDAVWPHPWDSPGKNTGVGWHFLLQCRKVKSESEVAQSCQTLCNPMDCSLPGSSVHGIFQARVLEWVAIAFSLGRLHCWVKEIRFGSFYEFQGPVRKNLGISKPMLGTVGEQLFQENPWIIKWLLFLYHWYYFMSERVSCSVVSDSLQTRECSLSGFSVRGISRPRILEWVAILLSGGCSQLRDWTWVSCTAGRFFTVWAIRIKFQ